MVERSDNSDALVRTLADKIRDQEEQIALLQRQQRDVRFLAKRLTEELQIRLSRRAKQSVKQSGLVYEKDKIIRQYMDEPFTNNKQKVLTFIHERDKHNIRYHQVTLRDRLGVVFWKVAAGVFIRVVLIMKKIGKRVVYDH
jgi:hypothetical protein